MVGSRQPTECTSASPKGIMIKSKEVTPTETDKWSILKYNLNWSLGIVYNLEIQQELHVLVHI